MITASEIGKWGAALSLADNELPVARS